MGQIGHFIDCLLNLCVALLVYIVNLFGSNWSFYWLHL